MEKTKISQTDPGPMLLSIIMDLDMDENLRPPWKCEKIEEFFGSGTDYVWQIYSKDGGCISYVKSSVDAPAIVAKVNEMEWEGLLA